ncbi:MAG TPA: energy transducer TonB [Vicinamibacterales bacterium]|nr:energy transducer TonB [Vicinamibacterales bacterium]
MLDVIIDEQGRVESATIRESAHPQYDLELLKAARTWTYTPARRGDRPIKYRKTIIVRLNAQSQ